MRQPGLAVLAILAHREAVDEAGLVGPAVTVGKEAHLQPLAVALELGRERALGAAERLCLGGIVRIGIAELHHEIVLRAVDTLAIPEVLVGQCLDVAHVLRRERRGQFDDDAAGGQVHVQQVGRVGRAPVAVRRCVQDLLRAAVGRGRAGQGGKQAGQGKGEQGRTTWRHGRPVQEGSARLCAKRTGYGQSGDVLRHGD
ncbi:hypothetical protein D3C71_1450000 [compost metagenome]